jgi:hypothetical protein
LQVMEKASNRFIKKCKLQVTDLAQITPSSFFNSAWDELRRS